MLLDLGILGLEGAISCIDWLEPPTNGQPPKRGQKLCSQSVLYSEVPLYIIRGGFMQKSQIYKGLTCCSECEGCNEIHSKLQTNDKVPTPFAFCINPSCTSHIL